MSLRINTNVEAFNAHRNLVTTENQLSTSMERLSSGFRINRAGTTAAANAIVTTKKQSRKARVAPPGSS